MGLNASSVLGGLTPISLHYTLLKILQILSLTTKGKIKYGTYAMTSVEAEETS